MSSVPSTGPESFPTSFLTFRLVVSPSQKRETKVRDKKVFTCITKVKGSTVEDLKVLTRVGLADRVVKFKDSLLD